MIEFLDAIRVPLVLVIAFGAGFFIAPWLLMFWPGWDAFRR